jgi:hypothetical protein
MSCAQTDFTPVQSSYDQVTSTVESISNVIGPFLSENLNTTFSTIQNDSSTLLIIDFDLASTTWLALSQQIGNSFHYHEGRIPVTVHETTLENKTEFVNGLLDTAGFCNAGGWVPRKGENSEVRQRIYFQIVKNWRLVVEIDNFLRKYFQVPIQTIDWGHPNIRDSNLKEASSGKTAAYGREHQIKIYPEYLSIFTFRISSKKNMFDELHEHNSLGRFKNSEDWFPPKKVSKLNSHHPDEENHRMPLEVRRHFDAFWQINLALGCSYLKDMESRAVVPEAYKFTGNLQDERSVEQVLLDQSRERPIIPFELRQVTDAKHGTTRARSAEDLEFATYPILKELFDAKYFKESRSQGEFYVTSNITLGAFIKESDTEFLNTYDYLADYKIRPDLVGFDKLTKKVIFIESKVDVLDLRMVGQLLAYCIVANPDEAHLISTKPLSTRLLNTLSAGADILEYSPGRKITIGKLEAGAIKYYEF